MKLFLAVAITTFTISLPFNSFAGESCSARSNNAQGNSQAPAQSSGSNEWGKSDPALSQEKGAARSDDERRQNPVSIDDERSQVEINGSRAEE
jgi:hypothetical protein